VRCRCVWALSQMTGALIGIICLHIYMNFNSSCHILQIVLVNECVCVCIINKHVKTTIM
jgi:hypothetical protein